MRFPKKKRIIYSLLSLFIISSLFLLFYLSPNSTFSSFISDGLNKVTGTNSNVILYDKTYNETSRTVTIIRNSTGDKMITLTLLTDVNHHVIYGTNRTIAIIEVTPIEPNMRNFMSSTEVYQIRNDGSIGDRIDREIHWQWREEIGQQRVTDYITDCSVRDSNGLCPSVSNGSHFEKIYRWNDFNITNIFELPKDKFQIRALTNVYPNEKVEWIPTFFEEEGVEGVRVEEWATWSEGLSTNLEFYFDGNQTLDKTGNNHNITIGGNVVNGSDSTKILPIPNAIYNPGASGDYMNITNNSNILLNSASGFSINWWINGTADSTTGSYKTFFKFYNNTNSGGYMRVISYGNVPYINAQGLRACSTAIDLNCGGACTTVRNSMNMITIVGNSTHIAIWQNGVHKISTPLTSCDEQFSGDKFFGAEAIGSRNYNAWFDEISYHNRDLSSQEISDLYNGGAGLTIPGGSTDASPVVTLVAPANNTMINNTYTVYFNGTFTDDIGLSNSTLYVWYNNGSLYNTYFQDNTGNINLTRNQSVTFPSTVKNEKFKWNYYVWDNSSINAGVWGSSNYTFNLSYNLIVTNFVIYPINSSGGNVSGFTSANLREIEKVRLNFTIQAINGINGDMTLYFTANGTGSCSLGNRQSDFCYNYPLFIQVKNGTVTATYNAGSDGGNQGDSITCQVTGNNTDRQYGCLIDEHYNPNVFKWYKAGYNFSDFKWQDGIQQRITGNNYIRIYFNKSIVPVNADIYKLDARLNYTQLAGLPANLEVYACNSSYVTGDPTATTSCTLAGVRNANELQDDGTKFRVLATTAILQSIYEVDSFVLLSDSVASSKYFSLKTFKATTPGYTTHWEYSTNAGGTWTNLGDGYETEFNINWFYDGGGNSTEALYQIEVTDLAGETMNSSIVHQEWDINATQPYRPIVTIRTPADESIVSGTIDINWTVVERNDDNYLVNITLSNSTNAYLVNNTLYKGTNSVRFNTTIYYDGDYQLTVTAYENETTELLFGNDTHTISIKNLLTPPNVTSLTEYPTEPQEYNPTKVYWFNATILDAQGVDKVTLEFGGVNYTTNNISSNYYVSITNLGVGNWNYRWTANDTEGGVNNTETGTYNVSINITYALGLTATSPITYGQSTDASGSNCPSQLSCVLSPSNAIFGVGVSPVTFNYSSVGNTNYTHSSTTTSVTINQDTGLVYAYVNGSRADKSIQNGTELNLSAQLITGIGNIQSYLNGSLINNGNPISNMTTFNNVGIYNYTVAYSGDENYTASSEAWTITVSSIPVVTSACNSNITVLKAATQNNRPYGRLCYWLDFR